MSTLQKLQCDNCGGRIDRASLTCISCGMQYRIENETQELRIITETRKVDVLHQQVFIPDEILLSNPDQAIEYTIKRIAHDMAEKLIPYMEWESESNPRLRQTSIYARLRVARPTSGGETT